MWAMERVSLLGEGKAEKEREGVTSYKLFPSLRTYFSTKHMGQVAGRMVPKTCRVKGVYVQCLSVRPLAGWDTRSWAALPWEPQGPARAAGFSSLSSCLEPPLTKHPVRGAKALSLLGVICFLDPTQLGAQVRALAWARTVQDRFP